MAATTVNQFDGKTLPGAVAAENLVGGRFVNITAGYVDSTATALQVSIADSAEVVVGIVAETVSSGEDASVFCSGVGYLECDATTPIVAGDRLGAHSDNSGMGAKVTADNAKFGAIALAALASGTGVIPVLIMPYGNIATA